MLVSRIRNLFLLLVSSLFFLASCVPEKPAQNAQAESTTSSIIYGKKAKGKQWESVVALMYNNSFICSGSLIHPGYVLTAAHCIIGKAHNYKIYVGNGGEWMRKKNPKPPKDAKLFRVKKISKHKKFNPKKIVNGYDIAVMELEDDIENVKTVKLLSKKWKIKRLIRPGIPMTIVGFGLSSYDKKERKFGVKHYGHTRVGGKSGKILYASSIFHSRPYFGDSGGPALVKLKSGKLIQIGVASFVRIFNLFGFENIHPYSGWNMPHQYLCWMQKEIEAPLYDLKIIDDPIHCDE